MVLPIASAFYSIYFPGCPRKGMKETSLPPASLEDGSGYVLSQESRGAVLG